mgnify:CR=1 FL=1
MDVLFEMEKEYYTNQLLRNSLINFALDNNFKELFLNMTGEEWEKHLICPMKSLEYKYTANQKLVEHHDFKQNESSAILTEEKKKTLHQLMMLSKAFNYEMYSVFKQIYNDEFLITLASFIPNKRNQNSVFYMNKKTMKFSLKESREDIVKLSLVEAVEYFKLTKQPFFIEFNIYEKTTSV